MSHYFLNAKHARMLSEIEARLRAGIQRVLPPAIAEDGRNFLSACQSRVGNRAWTRDSGRIRTDAY